jgi:hypothetical protein
MLKDGTADNAFMKRTSGEVLRSKEQEIFLNEF